MKTHAARLLLALALVVAGAVLGATLLRPRAAAPEAVEKTLWTCSMHPQVLQDKAGVCPICFMKLVQVRAGGLRSDPAIVIDPVLTQHLGIRTALVEQGPLTFRLRAVGVFREADSLRRDVTLKVAGTLEKLHASVDGARVRKGEPLFDLYSPDLLVAQNELLSARRALQALPAGVDAGVKADTLRYFESARERLLLLDVPAETIDALLASGRASRTITFRSPADGFVADKEAVEGSPVEANRPVLRIVDDSTLWLDVQIPETKIPHVALGGKATARVAGLPERDFTGEVIFLSPRVEAATRSGTARLAFANPERALRPGNYATAEFTIKVAEKAILVPREAVIDSGVRQVAYLSGPNGRYEPREVRMGLESGDGAVQILSGLAPGERVVVSGQFLLDAESRMREGIRKLSDPAPKKAPEAAPEALPRAYLSLAALLAEDKPATTEDVDVLIAAAKAAGANAIVEAVEHLCCVPLKEQRERFKKVSEAAIAWMQKTPGAKLYVIRCPMAEASWLQSDDRIRNPYMGRSMPACGEVARTIEAGVPK